jgi:hypothetical protein
LIFDHVNSERVREGLNSPLSEPVLVDIARDHAMDMLEREFFDHVNPDGLGPTERVDRAHRAIVGEVSENVWTQTRSGDLDSATLAEDMRASPKPPVAVVLPSAAGVGIIAVTRMSLPFGRSSRVRM